MGEIFIVSLLSQCFFYRGPDLGDLIAGYGHGFLSLNHHPNVVERFACLRILRAVLSGALCSCGVTYGKLV